jgi:hypothetical protein
MELRVVDIPSFFLSVWNTKECENEGIMMMCGHHKRLKEVGKEGGWIIMKKQGPQYIV